MEIFTCLTMMGVCFVLAVIALEIGQFRTEAGKCPKDMKDISWEDKILVTTFFLGMLGSFGWGLCLLGVQPYSLRSTDSGLEVYNKNLELPTPETVEEFWEKIGKSRLDRLERSIERIERQANRTEDRIDDHTTPPPEPDPAPLPRVDSRVRYYSPGEK